MLKLSHHIDYITNKTTFFYLKPKYYVFTSLIGSIRIANYGSFELCNMAEENHIRMNALNVHTNSQTINSTSPRPSKMTRIKSWFQSKVSFHLDFVDKLYLIFLKYFLENKYYVRAIAFLLFYFKDIRH